MQHVLAASATFANPSQLALGIDLGGTKIEGAIFALSANEDVPVALIRKRIPTVAEEGYEAILARVAGLVHSLVRETGLDKQYPRGLPPTIGVGMPGGIVLRTGFVKNSNTICLNGKPFRQDLQRELGIPIRFANDANCFALAEARYGAAKGYDTGVVFGVILGTGVGGGWVLRGELWDGMQGIAGEWGHHTLEARQGRPCYCGRSGCVEAYLAGPALERTYTRQAGRHLPLSAIVAGREEDPIAKVVVDEMLDAFGRAMGNIISIIDPSVVVLGGGVSKVALLYAEGRAHVAKHIFNDEFTTPIVPAQLGDSAGVLGAALLVNQAPSP